MVRAGNTVWNTPASKQADIFIFSFRMVVVEVCSSFVIIMIRYVKCSIVNVVGVHEERFLPWYDFHSGYLQSHEWRASLQVNKQVFSRRRWLSRKHSRETSPSTA